MAKKIELNERHQELFNEVRKNVKRANQQLVRLERFSGRTNSWAAKRLESKLNTYINGWTENNRIRINKSMNTTKLRAINKAVKEFNLSETATIRGIKNVRAKQIEGLKRALSDDDIYGQEKIEHITDEEVEVLYSLFEDENARDIMQFIPSSDFVDDMKNAIRNKDTKSQFFERINTYITVSNDKDMVDKVNKLYIKYLK